jgi:hypothetical protein
MARISLNCKCGWNYFIPESTQGFETPCPNCGDPVRIPGRRPGQKVLPPGQLAAHKSQQQKTIVLLIGAFAGIVVLGIILVVVLSSGGSSSSEGGSSAGERPTYGNTAFDQPKPLPRPGPSAPAGAPSADPAPSSPRGAAGGPVGNEAEIARLKRETDQAVMMLNAGGVTAEVLRLRGCVSAYEQLQSRLIGFESNVQGNLSKIAAAGERHSVEAHMLAGDKIVGFAQRDVAAMRPHEAAAFLDGWLKSFAQGQLEQCMVQRGQERLTLYFFFKEHTKDLLELVRLPGTVQPDAPPPAETIPGAAPADPSRVVSDIPDPLIKQINGGFAALPAGYRQLVSEADRARLDSLFKAKKGTAEDIDFLARRIREQHLARFEQEHAVVRGKIAELEAKAREQTSVDTVTFKDGRKVQGKIEEETEEFVRIKSRLGSMKFPRADIARLERGTGAGIQFPERYKQAQGKLDALLALMAWCKENNLRPEADLCAWQVLLQDPLSDKARQQVSLPRPAAGPPPPAPPRPALPPATPSPENDAVARAIDAIATDVSQKHLLLQDVVSEMRRQTDGYRYNLPLTPPERSQRGVALITNPLTFSLIDLTGPAATQMGAWWGNLGADDRREFARFFGLWCAYARANAPRK